MKTIANIIIIYSQNVDLVDLVYLLSAISCYKFYILYFERLTREHEKSQLFVI